MPNGPSAQALQVEAVATALAGGSTRRRAMILLAAIMVLGLIPRLYGLTERSLWFDEAFCWRLIQFPLFEMLEPGGRDNHPPLYFILLQGWAALVGASAWPLP